MNDELEKIKAKKVKELAEKAKAKDAPKGPIHVTDADFDSTLKNYPLVLVDFWAEWCYPCKMVAPAVDALAEENAGKLVCAKVNVDESRNTASKFSIASIPTLILFKNGAEVERVIGALPKAQIEEKIAVYLE